MSRSFKFGMFEGFTTGAKKFYNNNKTAVDVSLGIAGAAAAAGATYVVLNNNNKKKIEESQQEILFIKRQHCYGAAAGCQRRRANHRHATAAVRSVEKRLKGLAVCMLAGVYPEGGHGTAVAGKKRGQGGMPD